MPARRKKAAGLRSLEKSTANIEKAVKEHKAGKHKLATLGGLGWIGVVITVVREFCKNWPAIKKVLKEVAAFLRKNGQDELAKFIDGLVRFLEAIHKVCPFIPKKA